jgi:alpha-amylase/alpha-mannosidase (GH57 family)
VERYVCIHSHFYQPPRENAWLEAIELQDSAYPYHDWNERITAECYAPNSASRILNGDGRIEQIVNNYARISFNFGPTILAWFESEEPDVYEAIIEADRESMEIFSGHGSAMAQAYNHMILPLSNRADKYTQILWGVRDFQHRFGRDPLGMWMPETAADLESLDIMAELGIQYTVLSPYQAHRVRPISGGRWKDVTGGNVDPTRPYRVKLPSGGSITVFFYDGPISQAVAFEGLLTSGETFAGRLMMGFDDNRDWPEVLHIATDGESYGHHHRYGDMALAYALHFIEESDEATLTNYAAYLAEHEITYEAEIYENSSWSCVHGVERWRSNCGCNSGGNAGWNQEWRGPLRDALDWLRDTLSAQYEEHAAEFLRDPWKARDDYIDVVLDRSPESLDRFLGKHAAYDLDLSGRIRVWKLLEMQRHAMLMYTSCGWFFDELSGIETVQVIQYAGRAVQLAQELFENSIEDQFLERLAQAKSNIPEHGDGRWIYEKFVKAAMVDLEKVGAHFAISSLFEEYGKHTKIYCYQADLLDSNVSFAGRAKLHVGQARITSTITEESAHISFAVVRFGDHNLLGGVRSFRDDESFDAMRSEIEQAFGRSEFPDVVRAMDGHFEDHNYTIRALFRDEQRKILDIVLDSTIEQAAAVYGHLHEDQAPLMQFLSEIDVPMPDVFLTTAGIVISDRLGTLLDDPSPEVDEIQALLATASQWGVDLDGEGLAYALQQTIDRVAMSWAESPDDLEQLARLEQLTELARAMPFAVDLWKPQNLFYGVLRDHYERVRDAQPEPDSDPANWLERFHRLGDLLSVRVE